MPDYEKIVTPQAPLAFYPGKAQLLPVAINIAISPLLLYLLHIWPWPPSITQAAVFVLTLLISCTYMKKNLAKPRLIFDKAGIHYRTHYYASEAIEGIQPYLHVLKVWVHKEGKTSEKLINLWWAKREDRQTIFTLALERYPLKNA